MNNSGSRRYYGDTIKAFSKSRDNHYKSCDVQPILVLNEPNHWPSYIWIESHLKFTIMKKIFTLLLAVGIVGIASAQSGNFDHGKKDNGYSFNNGHSSAQSVGRGYQTDRGYETNRHMSPWEREKQMRYMERQPRFEKRRHEYEYKKFTEHNRHNW
jgi:hypothetical protein